MSKTVDLNSVVEITHGIKEIKFIECTILLNKEILQSINKCDYIIIQNYKCKIPLEILNSTCWYSLFGLKKLTFEVINE